MAKNKKSPPKKTAPKSAPKKVRPAPAKTAAVKAPPPNGKAAKSSPTMEKPSKKNALRDSILRGILEFTPRDTIASLADVVR